MWAELEALHLWSLPPVTAVRLCFLSAWDMVRLASPKFELLPPTQEGQWQAAT